jgi:hypothetical protein
MDDDGNVEQASQQQTEQSNMTDFWEYGEKVSRQRWRCKLCNMQIAGRATRLRYDCHFGTLCAIPDLKLLAEGTSLATC